MIKTLRRKFIVITMVSVFAVLATLIGTMDVLNYYNVMKNIDSQMSLLKTYDGDLTTAKQMHGNVAPGLDEDGSALEERKNTDAPEEPEDSSLQKGIEEGRINQETPFSIRYFTVTISNDGTVSAVNTNEIAAISDAQAKSIALELYESGKEEGFYNDYSYDTISVEITEGETGTMYIFLNSTESLKSFRSFRNISLLISLLGLVLVYVLVLLLSRIAMKPVAESYEKQKHFITDASHEIKTPLAIIEANTEVLEMTKGDNEWLQSIRNQISRLSSLTEKLVFLSRMDEENTKLEMREFSLSKAVEEVAESFLPIATAKNKTLNIQVEDGISFTGNEATISQSVSLLVDNAMKYSNEEGTIDVRLRTTSKNKKEIIVYNTLEEIEVGNHDVLFERFYRADASRSTKTGGHGIGLSVVKAIVTAHKGKVTAESKDSHSIEFKILLP